MKKLHKIGLIALAYVALGFLMILIIRNFDEATWFLLGGAVSMFNYGQLLTSSKSLNKTKMVTNVFIRYIMILIILVFAYFKTQGEILVMILVLLGLIASKVGVIIGHLIFKDDKEVTHEQSTTSQ